MKAEKKIVLASASPRRKQMFKDMGLPFEVIPADIDESIYPGETPVEFAVRTAGEKGMVVATRLAGDGQRPWIVSADTIVVLDDDILTKPTNSSDAQAMLRRLSGRTHIVVTGWAVGRHEDSWEARYTATDVTFHNLTEQQIDGYVASGEGADKAGSYAIQGIGAFLVKQVNGCYFNVVGLPISEVVRVLLERGALTEFLKP